MNEDDRKKYIEELMQPHIPLRVLQEIRQEMADSIGTIGSHCDECDTYYDGMTDALAIIDKHIGEVSR